MTSNRSFCSYALAALAFAQLLVANAYAVPITNGLQLWLDASDGSTLFQDAAFTTPALAGDPIGGWQDKSGNAFHATQSLASRQPAAHATALNGRPSVRFDGTLADSINNDGMPIDGSLSLGRPYTAFIVDQYWGSEQGRTLQGQDVNWLMGKWGGRNAHYGGTAFVYNPGAGVHSTAIGEAIGLLGGSGYAVNGTDVTQNAALQTAPGRLQLGAPNATGNPPYEEASQADVAEVVVYNRVLSSVERQEVGAFLANKYGLASSYVAPTDTSVGTFSGGDTGEGLDLQGSFPYALNVGVIGFAGAVQQATFTSDSAPGATVSAVNKIPNTPPDPSWATPEYGGTGSDDNLETVMESIRWTPDPGTVNVDLANLVVGREYQLQLLFGDNGSARGFDVSVEGSTVAEDFNPGGLQLAVGTQTGAGAVGAQLTHTFTAADTTANIVLNGASTLFTDKNPILNGVTLEDLSAPATAGTFTGGDAGEGLDLQGHFLYAVNVGAGDVGLAGDANFRTQGTGGVTIAAPGTIGAFTSRNLGATASDNTLETVLASIRHAAGNPDSMSVQLDDLVPGENYKLQLLFADNNHDRGFDVTVDGTLAWSNLSPKALDGLVSSQAGVLTHEFTAGGTSTTIVLDGNPAGFPDRRPILNGLTLEHVDAPTQASAFFGGDAGEGLDLDGAFAYAVNVRGPATGPVRDARFSDDGLNSGATVSAFNEILAWATPDYGATTNDNNLEAVLQSIRWTSLGQGGQVGVDMPSLVPGQEYKLQLLFGDNGSARGFDVLVEGQQIANDFNPGTIQLANGTQNGAGAVGAVITHTFRAGDDILNVLLDSNSATGFSDRNPILNGFTLENLSAKVGGFTGGDLNEGLDLKGNFQYAVNVRGPAAGLVQDANFTVDSAPGVTVTAANEILNWHAPSYGATTNDVNLETVMQSIRWNGGPVTVDLADIRAGGDYKLQLLFAENCCDRGFDIFVENGLVVGNFNIPQFQQGIANTAMGAVVTYRFTAPDDVLNILLQGPTPFADNNPILNGFTLELIPEPGTGLLVMMGGVLGITSRRRRRK